MDFGLLGVDELDSPSSDGSGFGTVAEDSLGAGVELELVAPSARLFLGEEIFPLFDCEIKPKPIAATTINDAAMPIGCANQFFR